MLERLNAVIAMTSFKRKNLLINEKPAQITQHLYDADDNLLESAQVIEHDGSVVTVSLTFNNKTGLFKIRANGENRRGYGTDNGNGSSDEFVTSARPIYNASCEEIGYAPNTFYPIDYIAEGGAYYMDTPFETIYQFGKQVSGYNGDGRSKYDESTNTWIMTGDCTQGKPLSGYSVTSNAELLDSVNTFFNELKFPLTIK